MEISIDELIRSANLVYGNSNLDNQDYSTALKYYKNALEILFKLKDQQSGSDQANTIGKIRTLLEKAEYCKGYMESIKTTKVEKTVKVVKPEIKKKVLAEVGRKLAADQLKPKALPKRPNNITNHVKPAENSYETAIEQEIVDRSTPVT